MIFSGIGQLENINARVSTHALEHGCHAVRVYQNNNGTWTQIGADINGEADDNSGTSVSLNSDGNIVAIGLPNNSANGTKSGLVRIYKNISGNWTQLGDDIEGESDHNFSGTSVSLNSVGNIVAIGATGNDGVNGYFTGHVRVYEISEVIKTNLTQSASVGETILQISSDDQTKFSLNDKIVIDAGTSIEEYNEVINFGSLILKNPLKYDHGLNAEIEIVSDAEYPTPTPIPQPTPTPTESYLFGREQGEKTPTPADYLAPTPTPADYLAPTPTPADYLAP